MIQERWNRSRTYPGRESGSTSSTAKGKYASSVSSCIDNLLELLENPSRGEPLEEKTPENLPLPDSSLLSLICRQSKSIKAKKFSEHVIQFRHSALLCFVRCTKWLSNTSWSKYLTSWTCTISNEYLRPLFSTKVYLENPITLWYYESMFQDKYTPKIFMYLLIYTMLFYGQRFSSLTRSFQNVKCL